MNGFNNKKRQVAKKGRFLAIGIVFLAICIAHLVVLAVIQINGGGEKDIAASERRVQVAGIRGEIFDRNGKLLVGNSTTYDLVYEYGAMPATYNEINRELLDLLDALDENGMLGLLSEDLYVLEGKYPDLVYRDEVYDEDSNYNYHFKRTLKNFGLSEDTEAKELVQYIMSAYAIDEERYTSEEIDSLLRLWYEMRRVDFGSFASYTIASGCDYAFLTYIKEADIKGANFMSVSERVYHYPGIASHILGTVGRITAEDAEYYDSMGYPMDAIVGRSGCELAFEEWLRGSDGEMVIEYDEHGDIINTYYETEPQGGHDVYLTIDIDLQIAAEEGLAENVASVESAEAGALTAIDPNTGELLAIASYPTYDLSVYSEIEYYSSLSSDKNKPLLNRALNEIYAPGSTYKIGMALAALEENNIDRNTRCSCNGTYPYLHHPTCLASHGNIDIVEAIKESCNIFFYTIGHELGIDRITPYTSALGLGKSTGVELGEKTGNIAGNEYRESIGGEWSAGDDLSASIGQSDHGYTPLQLSVYMASIVNGGSRYSAHILKAVKEFYTGDVIYEYKPEVVEKVDFSGETYSILIDAMGKVVDGNTSLTHNFKDVGADVGGKTGTAQVTGREDYALFSGFAPLIAPEIVVSCVIEEGVHGYNASVGAASVFERYFDKKQEK
ncbi:MAG: hypothetical protein J6Q78_06640 [Clostridia bacterium]|nr:hypothetical protein [Clostridia bacterium]